MASISWSYRGRDSYGKVVEGSMEAENAAAVAERLRNQGLMPTSITAKRASVFDAPIGGTAKKGAPAKHIGVVQLSLISRQLATMIGSGISLVQALNILVQQIEAPSVRELINEVRRSVEAGETFSNSLAKFPTAFPPLFIYMVEAGEASGSLDAVLDRVAKHFEKQVEVRGKVKGALVYPAILVGVAAIAITALMMFVLPTFIDMFKGFNMELPAITRILFAFGTSMQHFWYIYFGAPAVGVYFFLHYVHGAGKGWFDQTVLRIPAVGVLVRKDNTAQFARTFGMLVQSGVPMLQALDLLDRVSGNSVVKDTVRAAKASVRDGQGLARPLRQSKIFPPMLAHMVGIGEETGALDDMLIKTADFYDQEVDYAVKNLTTAIEPAIILVIGVFAGLIVAAVMMPMFNMVNISM
ncbi:MAG: type II secretion system F family protein [Clostridia bacterium]|nr:type II secretion system F family protein [Clostridia bacterium]